MYRNWLNVRPPQETVVISGEHDSKQVQYTVDKPKGQKDPMIRYLGLG